MVDVAVARLVPIGRERAWMSVRDLIAFLERGQADPALRAELSALAGDTTDDLV